MPVGGKWGKSYYCESDENFGELSGQLGKKKAAEQGHEYAKEWEKNAKNKT